MTILRLTWNTFFEVLKRIPISVLPNWYSFPRSTDHIFDSIIEKYMMTPKVYRRHLLDLISMMRSLILLWQDVFAVKTLPYAPRLCETSTIYLESSSKSICCYSSLILFAISAIDAINDNGKKWSHRCMSGASICDFNGPRHHFITRKRSDAFSWWGPLCLYQRFGMSNTGCWHSSH